MLGTAIFGIATVALLPTGIYQALSYIVPPDQFSFRPGAGEALSGGLAALPLWLAYLWLVPRALRGVHRSYAGGRGRPPAPAPPAAGGRGGPPPARRPPGAGGRPPRGAP